jgi:ornithine carbamoyltransferase
MQILADLLTLHEHTHLFQPAVNDKPSKQLEFMDPPAELPSLPPLTISWIGDSTNVLHDILVSFPRLGHKVRVAVPPGAEYQCPAPVWDRVKELGCDKNIVWTHDPREAVNGSDVVITDTWYALTYFSAQLEALITLLAGYRWAKKPRKHSD